MSEAEKIEGEVDRVQFKSDDGSFCVIDVNTGDDLIKAVGELGNIEEGESVILTGEYVKHRTFGKQFRVQMFERSLPTGEASILRYLVSGALDSVKPVTAKRLVAAFGSDTLEIIENEPERLTEVNGIDAKKADAIHEDFKKDLRRQGTACVYEQERCSHKVRCPRMEKAGQFGRRTDKVKSISSVY